MRTLIWRLLISQTTLVSDVFPSYFWRRQTLRDFYEDSTFYQFKSALEIMLPPALFRLAVESFPDAESLKRVFPFDIFYRWVRVRPTRSVCSLIESRLRRAWQSKYITENSLILPLFPDACRPSKRALANWTIKRFYDDNTEVQWLAFVLRGKLYAREQKALAEQTGIDVDTLSTQYLKPDVAAEYLATIKQVISLSAFVDICKR